MPSRPDRPHRPSPSAPLLRRLAIALVIALLAVPASAYIVVLKDGSRIEAQKKYEVREGRAYIVLPNGSETYIRADEIDVPETERQNRLGRGGALVVEGTEVRERDPNERSQVEEKPRLSDLIESRDAAPSRAPERGRLERQRRDPAPSRSSRPTQKTPAGFTDLSSLPRRPLSDLELAADLQRFFRGQGVEGVQLYVGTRDDRPFVEVTTNSEASVFRALRVSAEALLAVRGSHEDVAGLEILLTTPERQRAGQFVLTPELAEELAGDALPVARFFVENVQF